MKNITLKLVDAVLLAIVLVLIIVLPSLVVSKILNDFKNEPNPMSKQNVVCDLVYGVQYFEHNGSLTVRINHEGVPIRCYEENN